MEEGVGTIPTRSCIILESMVGLKKELFADHFLLAIIIRVRDVLDVMLESSASSLTNDGRSESANMRYCRMPVLRLRYCYPFPLLT